MLRAMNFPLCCAAFAAVWMTALSAAAADNVAPNHPRCSRIADDRARLACYDAIDPPVSETQTQSPPTQQPPGLQEKEDKATVFGFDMPALFKRDTTPQTTPAQFGGGPIPPPNAPEDKETKTAEIQSITAQVTSYSFSLLGTFTVSLDNGQVWRQVDGDTDHAHFGKAMIGSKVTITRGILGSYNLAADYKIFKVFRVK